MTDYRMPATMNLWNDENASVMDAFMNSDLSTLWPPPQSSASTSVPPTTEPTKPFLSQGRPPPPLPPPPLLFNQETLQQRLQTLFEGARDCWTYAIFWQSSYDYSCSSVLGWGDGYYKGEEDKAKGKLKSSSSSVVKQEHRKQVLRDLNALISGPTAVASDDAIDEEVTDTEWFFLVSMTHSFVQCFKPVSFK